MPTATATATTSPSPEETEPAEPAPTLPPKPAAMSEETEEGAIATVRYFIDAVNMAYATNDPSYFEDLATDDCGSCDSIASDLNTAASKSQIFINYNLTLGKIEKAGAVDAKMFGVAAKVHQGAIALHEADGTVVEQVDGESNVLTKFALVFVNESWAVREFVA